MPTVYLNGKFIAQEEATISIMDRGFLFGDGVYESIPVYDSGIFSLQQHLMRLEHSLAAIQIPSPLSPQQWHDVLHNLLALNANQPTCRGIYIQVTRGCDASRNHAFPKKIVPTVLAFCLIGNSMANTISQTGLKAITLEDKRRQDCYIKATSLLPNILAYQQARETDAAEAILIRNGEALEGTSSNLFMVKHGIIYTPPISRNILAGTTREIILQIAHQRRISCEEKVIPIQTLFNADEIWLTGSLKEIYPIVQLDNQPVGNGQVGAMWLKMQAWYQQAVMQAN